MTGIITLNTNLSDPDSQVPLVVDYETSFAALNTNLLGWAEVRASAVTLDGSGNVEQLNDLSGNGTHFTNGAASTRPDYQSNIVNGRPAMFSDGTNTLLTWGGSLPVSADFSKVVLFRTTFGSGTTRHLFSNNATERNMLYVGSGDSVVGIVGSTSGSTISHSEDVQDRWVLAIQTWDHSTGTNSISINGGAAETDVTPGAATDQTELYLFAAASGGTSALDGYIAMAQVWNIDLLDAANSTELDLVKAYVRDTYGLTIA